ncbi:hypothetical protein ALNOE001_07140 [Candidatus Methanobinarius endosymbioticus]|uniref:Condensation domain-containing protein n=1 Tax=Candidatus Methanobinarius endosymbioticus TaxID=2006182 RepID=A0A366MDT5_9EURY|nr:hypothetical protein ALNOE001_07140 [Candidatus Methanobinarius endosymbioticus]
MDGNDYDFDDFAKEFNEINEGKKIPEFFENMLKNSTPQVQMPTKPKKSEILPLIDNIIKKIIRFVRNKKVATSNNGSIYELMISAFSITIGKYINNDEVLLGMLLEGRNKKAENLIGMFVRTLPFLFKPQGNIYWKDYLQKNKEEISSLKLNQRTSFENITHNYSLDESGSRAPIFDIITNYLHTPPTKWKIVHSVGP